MFSKTSKYSRRRFLERSALGAGGALFLPGLIVGCTDHVIPPTDPNPPTMPPLLGDDYEIDWNDDAKSVVTTGLGLIPDVGGILSALVGVFWPSSGDDIWSQVKAQVEELINEKIADDVYGRVSGNLAGLKSDTADYLNALHTFNTTPQTDPNKDYGSTVRTNWISLRQNLDHDQPNFQQSTHEVLLLPLFAQFANIYLATLREVIIHGDKWGMLPGDVQQARTDLATKIQEFTVYAIMIYDGRVYDLQTKTPQDTIANQPFLATNTFERQMTLWVMDYADTWPYYDLTQHPNGAVDSNGKNIKLFTREIYSDPYGNTRKKDASETNPIVLPSQATQFPTQITVWGGNRIDAVQLTYPAGGGPGGVTTTPRMGDSSGGSIQGSFALSPDNPIVQAYVSYDYFERNINYHSQTINTMYFAYTGAITQQMGKDVGTYNSGWISYTNMALSSIYIQGVNVDYGNSANCIVFGFMYWQSPAATLRAIRSIYVTSPKEHSVADFAKSLPKLAIPADLISDDLKAARKAYWESLQARAKK